LTTVAGDAVADHASNLRQLILICRHGSCPRGAPTVATNKTFWGQVFFSQASQAQAFMSRTKRWERGATESPGDAAEAASAGAGKVLQPAGVLRSKRRPLAAGETLRTIRSALRRLLETGEATCRPYAG